MGKGRGSGIVLLALAACGGPRAPAPSPSGPSAPAACDAPDPNEVAPAAGSFTTVALCKGLFGDPTLGEEERAGVRRAYVEALAAMPRELGGGPRPIVVSCKSDACAVAFTGPTRRSHAFLEPRPMVVVNGGLHRLTKGTTIHEMIHVAIALRMGKSRPRLPTWFDEGVATFIGDNGRCTPRPKRAIDDLRRLDTNYAWNGFTNMAGKLEATYCQARDEVGAWIAKRGRAAVLEVVDGVAAGGSFDALYGPLLTAIPPEAYERALDARFPLDENEGNNAVDATGRAHVGSLMGGAVWTTGRRGAGVKVGDGAVVRVDGLSAFGVTDSPFTVSLWVKPLAGGHVLVHTAKKPSGGDGWCLPLLGHDARGRLTAQVGTAPARDAFLTATGPSLRPNAWSHVAVTWSAASGVRLYVNGTLAAEGTPRTDAERHRFAAAAPTTMALGSDLGADCWTSTVTHGAFSGVLDELRVYDYELGAAEVAADMESP